METVEYMKVEKEALEMDGKLLIGKQKRTLVWEQSEWREATSTLP